MHVRHPLAGYPSTIERSDDRGLPAYEIVPQEWTPEGAIRKAQALRVLKVLLAVWTVYEWYNHGWSWVALVVMGIVSLIVFQAASRLSDRLIRKKTKLVLTCDFVSVLRDGQDWEHIRYSEITGFTLRGHDFARDEQLQLEYDAQRASQRQVALRKRLYYGESFHISTVHLGQQVDLFTVYGQKDARAIVERLQLCYRMLSEWRMQGSTNTVYSDLGLRSDV
jgi:hypothetical protein